MKALAVSIRRLWRSEYLKLPRGLIKDLAVGIRLLWSSKYSKG